MSEVINLTEVRAFRVRLLINVQRMNPSRQIEQVNWWRKRDADTYLAISIAIQQGKYNG